MHMYNMNKDPVCASTFFTFTWSYSPPGSSHVKMKAVSFHPGPPRRAS